MSPAPFRARGCGGRRSEWTSAGRADVISTQRGDELDLDAEEEGAILKLLRPQHCPRSSGSKEPIRRKGLVFSFLSNRQYS